MTTLERVTLMRKQGISEEEIIKRLQAERISPKEILDSLEQSKIKSAVSDFNSEDVEGMQPSMMGSSLSENPLDSSEPIPVPQPTEETYKPQQINYAQQANYSQQQDYQTPYYQPQEQNYSQEYYPQEGYENYSGTITQTESATETTIEIAEQVVLEKTKKMQKQVSDFLEFKTLFETKIENIFLDIKEEISESGKRKYFQKSFESSLILILTGIAKSLISLKATLIAGCNFESSRYFFSLSI